MGETGELAAFDELAKGEAAVPTDNASCQWVQVPTASPAIGKTLAELHIRRQFGVLVQAIRREGKYIRFPDGSSDVQAGDRLLLCGGFYSLIQASHWLVPAGELSGEPSGELSEIVPSALGSAIAPETDATQPETAA